MKYTITVFDATQTLPSKSGYYLKGHDNVTFNAKGTGGCK